VLERYVNAVGGAAALRKLSSRVMKGTFELPAEKLSGTAEIIMAAPDRFYSAVSVPGSGDFVQAYADGAGWATSPGQGLREFAGQELAQMRRSSQFPHELRLRDLYTKFQVVEKTTEGDRPAWVLAATAPEGDIEKFYFDAESGLLLRRDSVQVTPEGSLPIEHRYAEYKAVDGVQVPTLLRHKDPSLEWQVKFAEIQHNVPVDPARFAKPQTP
jgi:hypothetical protein